MSAEIRRRHGLPLVNGIKIVQTGRMKLRKIHRYFNEEGFAEALTRVFLSATQLFFRYKKMYLYSLDLKDINSEITCPLPVSFRKAREDELSTLDRVMYHSEQDIRKRFFRGDVCYIGCLFDKIVYFSWVSRHSMLIPEIDKDIPLDGSDDAYIYNVRTSSAYRGKGISTYAYAKIAAYLRDCDLKRLYVAVEENNIASVKSIEKSGFKMIREIAYLKIFSFLKKHYEVDVMESDRLKCTA